MIFFDIHYAFFTVFPLKFRNSDFFLTYNNNKISLTLTTVVLHIFPPCITSSSTRAHTLRCIQRADFCHQSSSIF